MNVVKTKIQNLGNTIKTSIDEYNYVFIKRRNKDNLKQLDFRDMIFVSAHLVNT